ncbi:MAG: hypothetical protein CR980_01315 [Propionibacteriales bacterium]|nr:MAG: hypothetical protein CR980_01315 [Propionibacteriales bacterium]
MAKLENRRSRKWRTGITVAVASLAMVLSILTPTKASADPDAVAKARNQLAKIDARNAELDTKYAQLQDDLAKIEKRVGKARKQLNTQKAAVSAQSNQVGRLAAAQFQMSNVGVTAQLLTRSDAKTFISSLGVIDAVNARSLTQLQQMQLAQANITELNREILTAEEQAKKAVAAQKKLVADSEAAQAEAQKVLKKLTKEERARLQALEATRDPQQPVSREDTRTNKPKKPNKPAPPVNTGPASGAAKKAMNYAMAQRGKRYRLGGTGPNAYDCSGLMMMAYRSAGISIPRTAGAQFRGIGHRVSRSDLKPGDLVFYYRGIRHVGMYIGNGRIVHAANPRRGIVTTGVFSMPYMGARRVG